MDTERICKEFDTIDRLIISGIRHDGDKIILPCVYKGGDDDYLSLSAIKTVIDHIVPKVQGGTKALANCYAACQRCNSLKSDKSLKHFRPLLAKELDKE